MKGSMLRSVRRAPNEPENHDADRRWPLQCLHCTLYERILSLILKPAFVLVFSDSTSVMVSRVHSHKKPKCELVESLESVS